MKDIKENWKPVIGFETYYEVSDMGRTRRIKEGAKTFIGRISKPILQRQGYAMASFSRNSQETRRSLHRVVAEAFIGECPEGKEVNHKNGIKDDNRLCNLEYITHSENVKHAFKNGLMKPMEGEAHHRSKLKDHQVLKIRQLLKEGFHHRFLAKKFNVCRGVIAYISTGGGWKHI